MRQGHSDDKHYIHGLNPVIEALRSGRKVGAVYVYSGRKEKLDDITSLAEKRGVSVHIVGGDFFERFPKGHQGIAVSGGELSYTPLDELLDIPSRKKEQALFILLDEVEDPGNVGAIARSAFSLGAHGMVIQKHRAAGLGPRALKAAAGAFEYFPVAMVPNIKNAMDAMRKEGIALAGAEGGIGTPAWKADLKGPVALILGSESGGLRRTVREKCDIILSIPMSGGLGSLNVAATAGMLLYETLRQRSQKQAKD